MKLTANELDQGLSLLKDGGLCELLPPFFEVDALAQSWKLVRPILERVDLREYQPNPALTLVAAKQRYVVRPVQLLDPLDCLLYSGLVARLAPDIERHRRTEEEMRVFSYRWTPDRAHILANDYRGFRSRAAALCTQHPFVAKADIADFFPSVYLHRLSNALEASTGRPEETRLLERWLMRWSPDTTPTSIGLPVGQLASNVLAEALLIEVDDFLSRDHEFVRYVDDFLIFCDSRPEATLALHDLGQRLVLAERLNLNSSKTGVEPSERVLQEVSGSRSSLAELQDEFVERALGGDPYGRLDFGDMSEDLRKFIMGIDTKKMLADSLAGDSLNTQKLGFALQVMGALGDPSASETLIAHLPSLAAASRQIGLYFSALGDSWSPEMDQVAQSVISYIRTARFATPYQLIWLLEPFARSQKWNHHIDVLRVMKSGNDILVRRQALLGASQSRKRDALVDVKLALSENAWIRRAALFASRFLPADERSHVWGSFGDGGWTIANCLERSVVRYAQAFRDEREDDLTIDPDEIPF